MDYRECASFLYDGGWRADDRDLLIEEYGISNEDAEKICEYLAEFDKGVQ